MKNKTCICSVAFRQPYLNHNLKQAETISADGSDVDFLYFRDRLPMNGVVHEDNIVEQFQKSLYGFKPHAIQKAIDMGYEKIIWLDPSVLPTVSMQVLIDSLDENPMIVRSGEEWLPKMCNAKAKNYFNVTDEEIKDEHSVAGTVYCFNFNDPKTVEVFELWKKAEMDGIFGTQDDFMKGNNWADEMALSLSMFKLGIPKYWEQNFLFLNQKEMN